MWPFRRTRTRRLDARAGAAAQAAAHAEAEAELSRQRYESIRRHVVEPLQEAAEHNEFAAMIRASLINGRDRHEELTLAVQRGDGL